MIEASPGLRAGVSDAFRPSAAYPGVMRWGRGIVAFGLVVGAACVVAPQDEPPPREGRGEPVAVARAAVATSVTLAGPDSGFDLDKRFGQSVLFVGEQLLVGAPGRGAGGQTVYRYREAGGRWEALTPITTELGGFGARMAFDDGILAVSAPPAGPVSLFAFDGEDFVPVPVIDPAGSESFGYELALRGATLAIVDHPSVQTFIRDGDAFLFDETITPPFDASTIAAEDGLLLVGNGYVEGPRVVLVYARGDDGWAQEAEITPPSDLQAGFFGNGLALQDGRAFIGSESGIHVYDRDGGAWTPLADYTPRNGGSYWGSEIAVAGDLAVAGNGAASELTSFAASPHDELSADGATSRALRPPYLVLGHAGVENENGTENGAVEIITLDGALVGAPCSDASECLRGNCVDGVCCDEQCDGPCRSCSLAGGAAEDGVCVPTYPPACCEDDQQCVDGTLDSCSRQFCNEQNVCEVENVCCQGDADCEPAPPCAVICALGRCVVEDGCTPDSGATTGDAGGVGPGGLPDDGGDAGPVDDDDGGGDDGGCDCATPSGRARSGGVSLVMTALLLAARRRPRPRRR